VKNQIDKTQEYFDSFGDYSDLYNTPLNIMEREIVSGIASEIQLLEPYTIFTLSPYLESFSVYSLKERLKFTYKILKELDGYVILPIEHYCSYIALPYNMPYLKIK